MHKPQSQFSRGLYLRGFQNPVSDLPLATLVLRIERPSNINSVLKLVFPSGPKCPTGPLFKNVPGTVFGRVYVCSTISNG